MLDTMWSGAGGPPNPVLLARNAYISMIETAQNVADRYSLNREEIDAFALRSQQHAKAARDRGRLAKEIMPVTIPATKKVPARLAEHDEFIRDDTTAEVLAALPAQPGHKKKDGGHLPAFEWWRRCGIHPARGASQRPRRRAVSPS